MDIVADPAAKPERHRHHFRFHIHHVPLSSVFGNDWFALKAEAFARFFGTPVFLVVQSVIVILPFILDIAKSKYGNSVIHFSQGPIVISKI